MRSDLGRRRAEQAMCHPFDRDVERVESATRCAVRNKAFSRGEQFTLRARIFSAPTPLARQGVSAGAGGPTRAVRIRAAFRMGPLHRAARIRPLCFV